MQSLFNSVETAYDLENNPVIAMLSSCPCLKMLSAWLPCFLGLATSAMASTPGWPQFRGPDCSGVATQARPPIVVNPTNGVLWSIEVPWSPSSPSIWGEQL